MPSTDYKMSSCITVSLERQPVDGKLPVQLFFAVQFWTCSCNTASCLLQTLTSRKGPSWWRLSLMLPRTSLQLKCKQATCSHQGWRGTLTPNRSVVERSCRNPLLHPQVDHATGPVLTKEGWSVCWLSAGKQAAVQDLAFRACSKHCTDSVHLCASIFDWHLWVCQLGNVYPHPSWWPCAQPCGPRYP